MTQSADTSSASLGFVSQDLGSTQTGLDAIAGSAEKVSKSLTTAFSGAIVNGKTFDQTLQSIGSSLSKVLQSSAFKPVQSAVVSGLSSVLGASGGAISAFAEGGIVNRPTFFGMGSGGTGLMGERGAEAIVPLARGPDGRLGLASDQSSQPVSVNVHIATPDPDSFRRSEMQISGALARAVARGQRSS